MEVMVGTGVDGSSRKRLKERLNATLTIMTHILKP